MEFINAVQELENIKAKILKASACTCLKRKRRSGMAQSCLGWARSLPGFSFLWVSRDLPWVMELQKGGQEGAVALLPWPCSAWRLLLGFPGRAGQEFCGRSFPHALRDPPSDAVRPLWEGRAWNAVRPLWKFPVASVTATLLYPTVFLKIARLCSAKSWEAARGTNSQSTLKHCGVIVTTPAQKLDPEEPH